MWDMKGIIKGVSKYCNNRTPRRSRLCHLRLHDFQTLHAYHTQHLQKRTQYSSVRIVPICLFLCVTGRPDLQSDHGMWISRNSPLCRHPVPLRKRNERYTDMSKVNFFRVQIDSFSNAIRIESSILIDDQLLNSKDVSNFWNQKFWNPSATFDSN